MPENYSFSLIKKEQVAKDTWAFYFDRVRGDSGISGSDFSFLPGQYIRMTLDIPTPDERGKTRLFSIATSPSQKNHIRIVTKIIQSSFKKTLRDLPLGSNVQFFGPMGAFTLKDDEIRPLVFLAGGIGITPFLSIVSYAVEKKLQIPITLFASYSTVEETIYYKELSEKVSNSEFIKIIYTITQPDQSQNFLNGEIGRISEDLILKYVTDTSKQLYYIAGPQAMVSEMEAIIKGMGVPQEQIKKENFVGY